MSANSGTDNPFSNRRLIVLRSADLRLSKTFERVWIAMRKMALGPALTRNSRHQWDAAVWGRSLEVNMKSINWVKVKGNREVAALLLAFATALGGGAMALAIRHCPTVPPSRAKSLWRSYRVGARIAVLESEIAALEAEKAMLQIQLAHASMSDEEQRQETKRNLREGDF